MSERLLPDWGWACILQAYDVNWAVEMRTSFIVGDTTIKVEAGGAWRCSVALASETAQLLDIFLPLVTAPGPLVVAQLGQSLDGRIATESGASHYINGPEARMHLHRLRAVVDAVIVGVGTLNADNPQLTVRHVPGVNPLRVVLDPRGRANPAARVFHDRSAPTLHLVADGGSGEDPGAPGMVGSGELVRRALPAGDAGFDPAVVLAWLHAAGYRRVLVEGGGVTVSRFLQAGVLDRLHMLVAPMLIGSGRPGLALSPIHSLEQALRPMSRCFSCGGDVVFDLDLRRQMA